MEAFRVSKPTTDKKESQDKLLSCGAILDLIGIQLPERLNALRQKSVKEFGKFFANIFASDSEEDVQAYIEFLKRNNNLEILLPIEYIQEFKPYDFFSPDQSLVQKTRYLFRSPLSIAAARGKTNTIRALLEAGAKQPSASSVNVVFTDLAGVKIAKELVALESSPPDLSEFTLSFASSNLQLDSVRELLKTNKEDPTYALFALANSYGSLTKNFNPGLSEEKLAAVRIEIAKLLITAGANVNAIMVAQVINSFDLNPVEGLDNEIQGFYHLLSSVVRAGDAEFVNLLLSHIKYPVIVTRAIETTSYYDDTAGVIKGLALTQKSIEIEKIVKALVEYLLAANLDKAELTALFNILLKEIVTSQYDQNIHETIIYLINKGADPTLGVASDSFKGAIAEKNLAIFELCLNHGASLSTAMHSVERLENRIDLLKDRFKKLEKPSTSEIEEFKNALQPGEAILKHYHDYLAKMASCFLAHLDTFPAVPEKFMTEKNQMIH